VGSVFYGIPKEDFPAPALEKGWRPKKKRPSKKKKK
jgi:hypothetical protein